MASTPARAKRLAPFSSARLAPSPDGPLTHFASQRGEKYRPGPRVSMFLRGRPPVPRDRPMSGEPSASRLNTAGSCPLKNASPDDAPGTAIRPQSAAASRPRTRPPQLKCAERCAIGFHCLPDRGSSADSLRSSPPDSWPAAANQRYRRLSTSLPRWEKVIVPSAMYRLLTSVISNSPRSDGSSV